MFKKIDCLGQCLGQDLRQYFARLFYEDYFRWVERFCVFFERGEVESAPDKVIYNYGRADTPSPNPFYRTIGVVRKNYGEKRLRLFHKVAEKLSK